MEFDSPYHLGKIIESTQSSLSLLDTGIGFQNNLLHRALEQAGLETLDTATARAESGFNRIGNPDTLQVLGREAIKSYRLLALFVQTEAALGWNI